MAIRLWTKNDQACLTPTRTVGAVYDRAFFPESTKYARSHTAPTADFAKGELQRFLFACILLLLPVLAHGQITKTERFDFPAGGTLRIENSTDELTVQGWDRPDVEITTIKSKHIYDTDERDTAGLDKIRVTTERRGNELVVHTDFPRYDVFPPPLPIAGGAHFELEYRINAPRNAAVIVNHDAGEVHIDNIAGDVHVSVQKGGMTLRLPEEATYAIDARTDMGSIFSDFPAKWHRRFWPLGARYEQTSSTAGHKLYLRAGFGDIAILKIRKPPYALPDQTLSRQ